MQRLKGQLQMFFTFTSFQILVLTFTTGQLFNGEIHSYLATVEKNLYFW